MTSELSNHQETGKSDKNKAKKNTWFVVNPYLITGVVGASFCFAWFFTILTTPSLSFSQGGIFVSELMSFVFVSTILVTYLIIWFISDWAQSHRGVLVLSALLLGSSNVWFLIFASSCVEAEVALAVCSGVGVTILATLWAEFLCVLLERQVRSAFASALVLALLWSLGVKLFQQEFVPLLIVGLATVSGSLYLFLKMQFSLMDDMPQVPAEKSDIRFPITWQSSLLTIMASLAQGFVLYWLLLPQVYTATVSLLIVFLAILVSVALLWDSLTSFRLRESIIRKLFLPVLAACILSLFFLPTEFRVWPCIAAFAFSLLPYSTAIFATSEHIVRCGLSGVRAFARARLSAVGGLLMGLGLGWSAFSSNILGEITLPVVIVLIVMVLIVVWTALSTTSYYPGEETPRGKKENRVRIGPDGNIIFTSDTSKDFDGKKYFIKKCNTVASQNELSKRQTEVLYLLAKGRNAEYIQKQLVISPHTVKAHIYNIYRKTGAHSRQDLIDLVENIEIDESEFNN